MPHCVPEGDDVAVLADAITHGRCSTARGRPSRAKAQFAIDSDLSAARSLKRALGQENRQLVVCGSSHRGDTGKVSIGHTTLVRGVIDDHIPALGWPSLWIEPFRECWNEIMDEEVEALRTSIEATTAGLSVPVNVEVDRDVAAASLLDLSLATALLVIGSRRRGSVARLLLGGTGEALVHGAYCSLLIAPRPEAES
jgi:Universal stress protein family